MTSNGRIVELVGRALRGEAPGAGVSVRRRRLRGGLTARSVTELRIRYVAESKRRDVAIVVKHLSPAAIREALVYEQLLSRCIGHAPRLLHVARTPAGVAIVLERVRRARAWPWRDATFAGAVLSAAARLHTRPLETLPPVLAAWDYERELAASASATLAALEASPPYPAGGRRWPTGPARRIATSLAALRAELLSFPGLAPALLHGDLHPGNVLLHGSDRIVLLDWERARVGSPLEDVASWLVSLGHHEPEARRRHDTLLCGYLAARGLAPRLGPELRRAYWIAAASNALAGALRYHLVRCADPVLPEHDRCAAAGSARAWLRVLRRADAWVAGGAGWARAPSRRGGPRPGGRGPRLRPAR